MMQRCNTTPRLQEAKNDTHTHTQTQRAEKLRVRVVLCFLLSRGCVMSIAGDRLRRQGKLLPPLTALAERTLERRRPRLRRST